MLQQRAGEYRSFAKSVGLAGLVDMIRPEGVRKFPEEAEQDVLTKGMLEIHAERRYLPVSLPLLDRESSLIWTADRPTTLGALKGRTHRVYVLRDGRDVVASLLHKVIQPDDLAHTPDYECTTIEQVLALPGYVERLAKKWGEHVTSLWAAEEVWTVVRYESLVHEKRATVAELANALGLPCDDDLADLIVETTSVKASREHAPNHTRRAKPGGHADLGITSRVEDVIGSQLVTAGYPLVGAEVGVTA
jgi:hypothetical protein